MHVVHVYRSVNWFLVLMTIILISVSSMAFINSILYLYGKPVLMKRLYNDEMGRLGYAVIAAFVVVGGFVLLYLLLR